jgi:hypothetical protein
VRPSFVASCDLINAKRFARWLGDMHRGKQIQKRTRNPGRNQRVVWVVAQSNFPFASIVRKTVSIPEETLKVWIEYELAEIQPSWGILKIGDSLAEPVAVGGRLESAKVPISSSRKVEFDLIVECVVEWLRSIPKLCEYSRGINVYWNFEFLIVADDVLIPSDESGVFFDCRS